MRSTIEQGGNAIDRLMLANTAGNPAVPQYRISTTLRLTGQQIGKAAPYLWLPAVTVETRRFVRGGRSWPTSRRWWRRGLRYGRRFCLYRRGGWHRDAASSGDALGNLGSHFGFHRFELGSYPPRDRVELRISSGELRVRFVELHPQRPQRRVDAVCFCGELVDAANHLPDHNAEYGVAGNHRDQYSDDDIAETGDGCFHLLGAFERGRKFEVMVHGPTASLRSRGARSPQSWSDMHASVDRAGVW